MSDKDPLSPATTSHAYDRMLPDWMKIQTVLDGTRALRAAASNYMPQHENESNEAYAERVNTATLFNLTKRTLSSWVGRPFSDPVRFRDVPTEVEAVMDNVDMVGNNVQVFARNWFQDGLAKGFSHCYVDFPRTDTGATIRTRADDDREGVRPYWVHVRPEQVFFAHATVVNGRETLQEVRIYEDIVELNGYAEVVVPQIRRVLMTEQGGLVELYRETRVKGKKPEWSVQDSYSFSLPFIPLVTFYAERDGFMSCVPPLLDLADLNIAHFQSTSEQRNILTVTRFPLLALSGGVEGSDKLVVGPNRWLWSPDPAGRFYYVEHTGAAIASGRRDIMDLEEQMAEYGADFLRKRPGSTTATARLLDSSEATSPLQDAALRFSEALDLALQYTADWLKLPAGGKSYLVTDFKPEEINQADLTALGQARTGRDISRKAYLVELKRRGILDEDYDAEADEQELEEEQLKFYGTVVEGQPSMEQEEKDELPEGEETEEGQ